MVCSVSSKKKGARSQERVIVDLDAEESVAEQVARLLAQQAGARASSSLETRKIRQSPHLSAKTGQSAGSDMRSGSQPHKHKLTMSFADAIATVPTPEERKAQELVEAQKQRNKKPDPEEGKAGKKDEFSI